MTVLAIDEFTFKVYLERGSEGIGVCICTLPPGRRVNFEEVELIKDHTRCNSGGVKMEPIHKMIVFQIQLNPEDKDDEAHKLHVETTAQGVLSGLVDCLANSGIPLVVDSCKPLSLDEEHLQMIRETSS